MDEDILAATIRGDEAKSLGGIEPLHRAQLLDRGAVGRRIDRSLGSGTSRLLLRRGAGIHADDLSHLWPLRSGTSAHLKRRARRYANLAAALDYAHMQE